MIDIETMQASQLPIGAKPGQILLFADLTLIPQPTEVLNQLKAMGYKPTLHFCVFTTGLHVLAVLKNEQFDPAYSIDDEYLIDEWLILGENFGRDAVRLWRGHPEH
jgi:hypothetical protein